MAKITEFWSVIEWKRNLLSFRYVGYELLLIALIHKKNLSQTHSSSSETTDIEPDTTKLMTVPGK